MDRRRLSSVIALCFSMGSCATAATITQTQGFSGTPVLKQTVEFDRFNPNYGQLVAAEWRLVLDIDGGSHTVDNDGMSEKTVSVHLGALASLTSEDVKLLDASMTPILNGETAVRTSTSSSLSLAVDNGDGALFDPTGPDALTHLGGYASSFQGGFVNPSYLDEYVGTEMFRLQVDLESIADLSDGAFVSDQVTPVTAWPNVVLIYQYEPVPEPIGFCLCGLAFISFAVTMRSRIA